MKKKPLPNNLPTSKWEATSEKPLHQNLEELYQTLTKGEGNQEAERTIEESISLLEHTQSENGKSQIKEIENLRDEDLLTRNISLWIESPNTTVLANNLPEAAPELETNLLFQKDIVLVEIHRRNLQKKA